MLSVDHPVVHLLADVAGPDVERSAAAETQLIELCQKGDAVAQRGLLGVVNLALRAGWITYDDFALRVADVFKLANRFGNIAELMRYSGDQDMAYTAHGEFLAILDVLATNGDEEAGAALCAASAHATAEALEIARRIVNREPLPSPAIPDADSWHASAVALWLCDRISIAYDLPLLEVRDRLVGALSSSEGQAMLDDPAGWSALAAAVVRGATGEEPPHQFTPTTH